MSIPLWESFSPKNENRNPFSTIGIYLPEEREAKSILHYEILSPRRTRTEVHSPLWESIFLKNENQ